MLVRRAALALCLLLAATAARAEDAPTTIFAAASTTDAVKAVIARYEATGDRPVRASFAASSTLAKQVAAGAPADLYLSANVVWMDWLQKQGMVAQDTRVDVLANRLVLVVPRDAEAPAGIADLPAYLGESRLAMGDPSHVPAGRYAKAALERLGLWQTLKDRGAYGSDVRRALALVARGEAAAGIVYATDARISDAVRAVATFPAESHPPIRYPLALVAGRADARARDFYRFLQGPVAARIFRENGFELVRPAS